MNPGVGKSTFGHWRESAADIRFLDQVFLGSGVGVMLERDARLGGSILEANLGDANLRHGQGEQAGASEGASAERHAVSNHLKDTTRRGYTKMRLHAWDFASLSSPFSVAPCFSAQSRATTRRHLKRSIARPMNADSVSLAPNMGEPSRV